MFADVSGSSALYKHVGNSQAKAIIEEALQFMTALTIVQDGLVVKTIGDEVMARFADCNQACETAVAIQQRCAKEPQLKDLGIRIGIAFGEVLLTAQDVFGDTVNDAAFVTRIARANQIVLIQSVVDELAPQLQQDCQMFDRVQLKGDQEKTLIYRLQWESKSLRHRATQVVHLHEVTQYVETFQLQLRQGERDILLLPEQMPYHIGRDPHKSQLVVENDLASREHCHIDFRRGKYVLVDHSTNGTYVCSDQQEPIYLRREELPLQGSGVISLGQPRNHNHHWLIHYHL
ncbi:adenylate/guanylate cyclase domain-containing protein [Cellvibrio japonicus]|nr:adenylate/guanylate cyclase domain-containing protein [Cellvibrio japonicus]